MFKHRKDVLDMKGKKEDKEEIGAVDDDVIGDIERELSTRKDESVVDVEPIVEPEKSKPVLSIPEMVNQKIKDFGGDMKRVQDFMVSNYKGVDLFTAGFQVSLVLFNNKLQIENNQRRILKNILDGYVEIPYDPRQPTVLERIIFSISPPSHGVVRGKDDNVDLLGEIKKLIDNKK